MFLRHDSRVDTRCLKSQFTFTLAYHNPQLFSTNSQLNVYTIWFDIKKLLPFVVTYTVGWIQTQVRTNYLTHKALNGNNFPCFAFATDCCGTNGLHMLKVGNIADSFLLAKRFGLRS